MRPYQSYHVLALQLCDPLFRSTFPATWSELNTKVVFDWPASVQQDRGCGARCVTFESPGLINFWRKKACEGRGEDYWKEHVINYLTFPSAP